MRAAGERQRAGAVSAGRFREKWNRLAADSHRALLGAEMDGISRLNGDSTPLRVGRWVGLRGHSLGMNAGVSPVHLQTPGTTSVSSVPGLSAPAAISSSTGASTLERSPCSECGGVWVGR